MFPAIALKTYSILLADDLALVREALVALCQELAGYRVVDQCSEGTAVLRLIELHKPDIAVLDLNLRDISTLEIVRNLRDAEIHTRIVVLSTRYEHRTAAEALQFGVHALLLKSDPAHYLVEAFDQILSGGIYLSPSLEIDKLFVSGKNTTSTRPLETLSMREFQVFSMLIEGHRAKEVAARLCLSAKTVDTYRASLMRKLDIHTLAGLVKLGVEQGITTAIGCG
jgi:DNA-binding NarL/FixJ family response regulator